jgi:hypothetical protein
MANEIVLLNKKRKKILDIKDSFCEVILKNGATCLAVNADISTEHTKILTVAELEEFEALKLSYKELVSANQTNFSEGKQV